MCESVREFLARIRTKRRIGASHSFDEESCRDYCAEYENRVRGVNSVRRFWHSRLGQNHAETPNPKKSVHILSPPKCRRLEMLSPTPIEHGFRRVFNDFARSDVGRSPETQSTSLPLECELESPDSFPEFPLNEAETAVTKRENWMPMLDAFSSSEDDGRFADYTSESGETECSQDELSDDLLIMTRGQLRVVESDSLAIEDLCCDYDSSSEL